MSNPSTTTSITVAPSFISRIASHDATRKGLAGAAAGLLVAAISELFWPST